MPKKKAKNKARPAKKAGKKAKKAIKSSHKPKKAVAKPKLKMPKKTQPETTGIYEETTITCPGCGRVTKVIKIAGLDTQGMICQRCAKGEIEIEEMDFG